MGGFVELSAVGFGDGVWSAITLGQGSLEDVRWLIGVSYAPRDSNVYEGALTMGGIQGGVALSGAAVLETTSVAAGPIRAGIQWLNQGRYLRIGVSRYGGRATFRVAGEYLGKIPEPVRKALGIKFDGKTFKWDWFDLGQL